MEPGPAAIRGEDESRAERALLCLAGRYIWWKTPEEAARYPGRVLAQVMDIGTFEDCRALRAAFGDKRLCGVLRRARLVPRPELGFLAGGARHRRRPPPRPLQAAARPLGARGMPGFAPHTDILPPAHRFSFSGFISTKTCKRPESALFSAAQQEPNARA